MVVEARTSSLGLRGTLSFLVSTLLVSTFFPCICVLCSYASALFGLQIFAPFLKMFTGVGA